MRRARSTSCEPVLLDGYAESFNFLARYLQEHGRARRPAQGRSSRQRADAARRRAASSIEEAFGCKVFDKYGSREFSGIAYECEAHAGHHVVGRGLHRRGAEGRPAGDARRDRRGRHHRSQQLLPAVHPLPHRRSGRGDGPDDACAVRARAAAHRQHRGARAVDHPSARDGQYLPGTFFAHVLKDYDHAIQQFQVVQERARRDHLQGGQGRALLATRCWHEVLATLPPVPRRGHADRRRVRREHRHGAHRQAPGQRLASSASTSRTRRARPAIRAGATRRDRRPPMSASPRRVVAVISRPASRYADERAVRSAEPGLRGGGGAVPRARPRRGARRHARVEPARRSDRAGRPRGRQAQPRLVEELHEKIARREAGRARARTARCCARSSTTRCAPPARAARSRVVDTPVEGCELEKVAGPLGICAVDRAPAAPQGHDVDFVDLRHFRVAPHLRSTTCAASAARGTSGLLVRARLPGDPRGYRVVDLARASLFAEADAPPRPRLRFHRSHYDDAGAAPHGRPPRVLDPAHGARRRRGHQPPQAEDAQEDGRHAGAQERHRPDQREVLAAALHRRRSLGRAATSSIGRQRLSRARSRTSCSASRCRATTRSSRARRALGGAAEGHRRAAGRATTRSGAPCSI